MKLTINHFAVTPRRFLIGTVGSRGVESMEITFSSDWEGLSKKVVFAPADGSVPVQVLYADKPILIPAEVYSARGVCRFAIVGYNSEKTLVSVSGELDVLETLPAEAMDAAAPTPTEAQQLHAMVQTAIDTANSLRADAEAGRFDGTVPHIGENGNWYLGTVDTGIYAVGYPTDDSIATKQNLWSADRIIRHANRNHSESLAGTVSGTLIQIEDALVVPGCEVNAVVEGKTTLLRDPSEPEYASMIPLTEATVTIYGKNLLDPSKLESGTLNANTGDFSEDPNRTRLSLYPLPAGFYRWGVNLPARTHFFTADGRWLSSSTGSSFSMPSDAACISAVWTAGLAVTQANPPLLTLSEDTRAEAFSKAEITLTLPELNGVSGACDTLESDAETGIVTCVRRTRKLTFDGTETWQGGNGVYWLPNAVATPPRAQSGGLCSHYVYDAPAAMNKTSDVSVAGIVGTTLYVYEPELQIGTAEGYRVWLQEEALRGKPLTVLCGNAADVQETYTDTALLGVTLLHRNAAVFTDATLKLTYYRSLEAVLQKLQNRIAALEDAVSATLE